MTYCVFGGTLNLALSVYLRLSFGKTFWGSWKSRRICCKQESVNPDCCLASCIISLYTLSDLRHFVFAFRY